VGWAYAGYLDFDGRFTDIKALRTGVLGKCDDGMRIQSWWWRIRVVSGCVELTREERVIYI
jgi:hypothetical protein